MTPMLRTVLLAALVASFIPVVAAGQGTPADSLLRRIDQLERRTTDLERRLGELESLIRSEPTRAQPLQTSSKWRDLQNWRQLRSGMRPDEVRRLLGEPEHVEGGEVAIWFWGGYPGGPHVTFMEDKVYSWSEPRQ